MLPVVANHMRPITRTRDEVQLPPEAGWYMPVKQFTKIAAELKSAYAVLLDVSEVMRGLPIISLHRVCPVARLSGRVLLGNLPAFCA